MCGGGEIGMGGVGVGFWVGQQGDEDVNGVVGELRLWAGAPLLLLTEV